jgi:hypothetical protein
VEGIAGTDALGKLTLRTCIFLCAFLVTVEICARVDDRLRFGASFWDAYSAGQLTAFSGNGIKLNVPNARFEKWHHNSHGFRGAEISSAKATGTVRVVCMGSSESYGLYESPEGEWPAQLQKLLPLPGWQVINSSIVGIDLRDYQAYLTKHVFPLNPDVIVVVVNPTRYATIHAREQGRTVSPRRTGERPVAGFPGQLVGHIRVLPKIKQGLKGAMLKSFPGLLRKYQKWQMGRQLADIEQLRLKGKKPLDSLQISCEDGFRRDLKGLVNLLKGRGIKVMLTSYPSLLDRDNISSYLEIFLDARRFSVEYSLVGMIDVGERLNGAMADLSVSEGTGFADTGQSVPRDIKYFGDNVHYTDQGARLVAETIAGSLQKVISEPTPDGGVKP